VLDVRVNELYTLEEVFDELQSATKAILRPRSLRWHSKGLKKGHLIFKIGHNLNLKAFGSPTLSDQVHCNFPTVKIGPGKSERSHTANEFIKRSEIKDALDIYEKILVEIGTHITHF
jgi:acetylornithine deacetylase